MYIDLLIINFDLSITVPLTLALSIYLVKLLKQ